jgi:hypothetical protein
VEPEKLQFPQFDANAINQAHDCISTHCGDIISILQEIQQSERSEVSCFGREAQTAYCMLSELEQSVTPDFSLIAKLQKTLMRGCAEPIVMSYRDILLSETLTLEQSMNLVAALTNHPVKMRNGRMFASGEPCVEFPAAQPWSSFAERLSSLDKECHCPVLGASLSFCLAVLTHPFTDGNGRFGRTLITRTLLRHNVIQTPCVSWSPVFHERRDRIASSMILSSQRQRWDDCISEVIRSVHASARRATSDQWLY